MALTRRSLAPVRTVTLATAVALFVSLLTGTLTGAPRATGVPLPTADPAYQATITRTQHGIPHIVAADYGSLGFVPGTPLPRRRSARWRTSCSPPAASGRGTSVRTPGSTT